MIPYKYPHKDKYISLFFLDKKKDKNNRNVIVKTYLMGDTTKFKAYVQDNSGTKSQDPVMTQVNSTTFVLNWRRHIDVTAYIEFDSKTYQVMGIDELDHRHTEVRITGQSVVAPNFDKVNYLDTRMDQYEYR